MAAPVNPDKPDDAKPEEEEGLAEASFATRKQIRREQRLVLFKSPGFVIGSIIVLFWTVSAIVPRLIANHGPKDFVDSVPPRSSPGSGAILGTDQLGRDVFSRLIFGARPILVIAPLATVLAILVGTLLGLLMGYYRGWVDEVIGRIVEAILSIPVILMAILVVFTFGSSRPVIIGTIGLLFVPAITRTVRSAAVAESQLDYVTSAKMRGETGLFIIGREILPNVTGLIVVEFTVRLGYAVFTYATLAFLGIVTANVTDADWGVDVASTFELIVADVWWPTVFPALAIASLVIGVNLIADSVDKALRS